MFDNNIQITGKHATYLKELAKKTNELYKDAKTSSIFNRYIDVYIASAIIGLLKNIRVEADKFSSDHANILAEQVVREQSNLSMLYNMTMLLHDQSLPVDERIDLAFKYVGDEDKVKQGMEIFNSYVRGGIEWWYDHINESASTGDEYITNLKAIVDDFAIDYYGES